MNESLQELNARLDREHAADRRRFQKIMGLRPSVRREYGQAKAAGDWATMARLLGEDVGTN